MGDQTKQDKIAALRSELADLEAQDRDKVPTLAEIKEMTPEQIEVELQRLAESRADDTAAEGDVSRPPAKTPDRQVAEQGGTARIAGAYGAAAEAAKRSAAAGEGDR